MPTEPNTQTATSKARRTIDRTPKEYVLIGGIYYNIYKAAPLVLMNWQTLLKKARNNEITHMKHGAQVLFKPEWLKEYLDEKTVIGTAKA